MKKIVLAAICSAAIGGLPIGQAAAQTTGPAPQDSMKMNDGMSKGGMSDPGMKKTTTGMSKSSKAKATKKSMKSDKMNNMEK
ncbi:hypothetical protein [Rhodopseudomonas pseudopalustris]|uniref:Pentapeptide MXKDX repeat protein n=1 Tax=Rhodopseudomonas pseudopalustris TaxID=1513892 RepID=A0A1H8MF81_9BRAD|nr:hypothetical protein [Rhodopseudomonas pseudopalustris]SEO16025.1 hypothetical protein SAMN05444123_101497 [Rhodopseudomonas pseudopalustris]